MKEIRKTFIALTTAAMIVFASAALPALADEGYTSDAGYTEDAGDTVPEPIAADNPSDTADQQQSAPVSAPASDSGTKKSGVSFGTVFLLFILGIIINAALSFVIGNRFYKLAKKDSHLQAEIRALRRDISEKFTGNITEVKEKASTVSNSNKPYIRGGGITYKEEEKPSDTAPEIAKRWNIEAENTEEPELTIKTGRRTKTTVERGKRAAAVRSKREKSLDSEKIDADEDVSESVKDKAKKFLGDIFPFEDE